MADRKIFWFGETVGASGVHNLNAIGDQAEAADHNLYIDNLPSGVCLGMSVSQQASPNLTVQVSSGVAYDPLGQRINIPSTQNVNLAVDSNGTSTTVVGVGNSKIISVFAQFARNNQTPFVDNNSVPGFEDQYESFSILVVQGTEAPTGTQTAPAIPANAILLADVTIAFGQTSILNSNIDLATRRAFAWRINGTSYQSPHTILEGTPAAAMADLLGWFNGHVAGNCTRCTDPVLFVSGRRPQTWRHDRNGGEVGRASRGLAGQW